jgi:hypothetical protein
MSNQTGLSLSRRIAAFMALFCATISFFCFSIGFMLLSGDCLALACFSSGFTLAAYLWWSMAKHRQNIIGVNFINLVMFVSCSGLALYSNLAYLLWGFGLPIALHVGDRDEVGRLYWLPPALLLYAILMWIVIRLQAKKNGDL